MAHASGNSSSYTPPRRISAYEAKLSLLPALYAPCGSYIMLHDSLKTIDVRGLPYFGMAMSRNMVITTSDEIYRLDRGIVPWGWNLPLRNYLINKGIRSKLLPSERELARWRALSHRQTSCIFHASLSQILPERQFAVYKSRPPRLFYSSAEAIGYISGMGDCFIKTPWSSSGRGVRAVRGELDETSREMLDGSIGRQGSVIVEYYWDKAVDFATEWHIGGGLVSFLGLSMFNSDSQGFYKGNVVASQQAMRQMLGHYVSNDVIDTVIQAQKRVLKKFISPWYAGPVGIDMLIDMDCNINACVEINLRHTMGAVALHLSSLVNEEFVFVPGTELAV